MTFQQPQQARRGRRVIDAVHPTMDAIVGKVAAAVGGNRCLLACPAEQPADRQRQSFALLGGAPGAPSRSRTRANCSAA
jgi:hypothetical protein